MNENRKRPRRSKLLFLFLLLLASFLAIHLRQRSQHPATANASASSNHFLNHRFGDSALSPLREGLITNHEITPPAADNDPPASMSVEMTTIDRQTVNVLTPPPGFPTAPLVTESTALAVVDLQRLIADHPLGVDSDDARARLLDDIRHIVANRAMAHHFALVLDASATSANRTPMMLWTNGVPDITDEVLRELAR
jgi:hypothetical protein